MQTFPVTPAAFLDTPLDAPIDAQYGNNVDVFAELARLPEPVPLGDPSAPMPDLLAPPAAFTEPLVGVPADRPARGCGRAGRQHDAQLVRNHDRHRRSRMGCRR